MRLPSLRTLAAVAAASLRRFPLAILAGIVSATGAIWLIEWSEHGRTDLTTPSNLWLTGMLGISLFIGIQIFSEHRGWVGARRTLSALAGLAGLVIFFILLPANVLQSFEHYLVTYGLLMVAAHFGVAAASFEGPASLHRFWDFNKSLFLRFLAAALYSGVLYVGLSVAVLALDELLGVTIEGWMYGQLLAAIALGFNTWFFVSTVPPVPSPVQPYPRALKTFSQFILIPLVAIYVLILYAYTIKIIAVWEWPEGWVANLVLGFSVTGILSLLFVYPIREDVENRWIRTIWRWYFPALFPLTILLLLAIWRRVSEYGVTPNRYFVIVMGVWLAGLVVYFTLRKNGNIGMIPLTFLALTLASSIGPWGALAVSERSQLGRLEVLLSSYSIIQDGSIVRTTQPIPSTDAAEISSIVLYLCSMHGPEVLRPWFGQRLDSLAADSGGANARGRGQAVASRLVGAMGVPFSTRWGQKDGSYFFRSADGRLTSISGYGLLFTPGNLDRDRPQSADSSGSFTARLESDAGRLVLKRFEGSSLTDSLGISLRSWLDGVLESRPDAPFNLPHGMMMVDGSGATMEVRVVLKQISARRVGDSTVVDMVTPDFLVRFVPSRSDVEP